MPGAKRRALKKLLSPSESPSPTPPSSSAGQSGLPIPQTHSSTSLTSSLSTSPNKKSSFSSFNPFKKGSGTELDKDSGSMQRLSEHDQSGTSIASNPANYLSDEALKQDLILEEMADREKDIGSGNHIPNGGLNGSVPPPTGPAGSALNGTASQYQGNLPPPPPQGASIPPPPPAGVSSGGGLYKPTPQQVTAEQLIFGDGAEGKKGKKSSKQRFAERQARKKDALLNSAPPSDPNWTAQLERERQEEIQVISDACEVLGREIYEIAPDGHCMFNAIADQLHLIGLIPASEAQNPHYTRHTAANYILAHPDDFMPFLPSITGEDSAGATDDGIMTPEQFQKYCKLVAETGEWGGEPEIQALSRAFSIPIHVIQRGPPTVVSHGSVDDSFGGSLTPKQSLAQGDRVVRISYHKRMYGLGEHYNSLRPVS